jgi:peptidoglycan DL-endopeptidase CwlO
MRTASAYLDRLFDKIVRRRKQAGGALLALAAAATLTYTVHPGDTLASIAAKECGTSTAWQPIYAANRAVIGADPNLIYAGQKLTFKCGASGAAVLTAAAVRSAPAPAGLGGKLLSEARTRTGDWYAWGGTGPTAFDCSGLVYWSAKQLGITLPRDTYGMLGGSPHLVRVYTPQPGDLAFFGSGHVELYVKPGVTFGAQQPGTQIGNHGYGGGYVPTVYLRLR